MKKILVTAVAITAMAFASAAFAQVVPVKTQASAKGKVLADKSGMTLYTFKNDTKSRSACNGPCAINWPPLIAALGATPSKDYTIVTRDDGGKQWAYKGKPLYTWINDKKPGDITGDGFLKGAWHIAKP